MKRAILWAMVLLMAFSAGAAAESQEVVCAEGRFGCQVLQMVAMGCFDPINNYDSLETRVFSAALPLLCQIPQEDFAHYASEFGVEEETVRLDYYRAISHCLWADMQITEDTDMRRANVRRVLKLFLRPGDEPNGEEQVLIIRQSVNDDLIKTFSAEMDLPEEYVAYLLTNEDSTLD